MKPEYYVIAGMILVLMFIILIMMLDEHKEIRKQRKENEEWNEFIKIRGIL